MLGSVFAKILTTHTPHSFRRLLGGILLALLPSTQAGVVDTNNLWDLSQGVIITSNSPVVVDIRNMFGGNYGVESNTIFSDDNPEGFVNFVEWSTPSLIDLSGIFLYAGGDAAEYSYAREFNQFTLKAKPEGAADYTTVLSYAPTHPYEYLDPETVLLVATNFPVITAKQFRAEFVQRTVRGAWDGSRVCSLHAIAQKHGQLVLPSTTATATATAYVINGFLVAVNVDASGSNYVTAPTVTISGGGGTGATATAMIQNGSVAAIYVNNAGSGYTSAPTITISAPDEAYYVEKVQMIPRLNIDSIPGAEVQIQWASSLSSPTNWQVMKELVLPNAFNYLLDTNPSDAQRFYRLAPPTTNSNP